MNFDTICVIGLGYIGLPTATMFASRRKKVIGVDINQNAVDTINRGEIHIVEPELDIAVHAAVKGGYLRATTQPELANAFLIAVPTPFKKGQQKGEIPTPDLNYIQAAADAIAPVLKKGNLVVLESTSPVGTTEQMAEWLAIARPDLTFPQQEGEQSDIRIAYCPERVLPGRVMHELIENDRIIGGMTESCSRAACELYKIFVRGACLTTHARTAEMAKLTENAYRDVNIAFANELSLICDKININVWELISLSNRHPRVNILQPGPGVGGHCIAVDPWFIISSAPDTARMLHNARLINDEKPEWVIEKAKSACAKILKKKENVAISILGLSFKADIDDLRESPALKIAENLCGIPTYTINIVEPFIEDLPESLNKARLCSLEEALIGADVVLVLVDHAQFKSKKDIIASSSAVIIDTRGIIHSQGK